MSGEARWFALRTRPRAEKKVSGILDAAGVEAYCPLREETRQWADRKKRVELPFFPGYLFARLDLEGMKPLLWTPGVIGVVREGGSPAPIRDEELEAVRRFEAGVQESGELPMAVDYLEPGEPVLVVTGPFAGLRGVLLERRGNARLTVKVQSLRQALAVQMDRSAVRPAA